MPPVTPQDVAAFAPGSPAVGEVQLQQASDWAAERMVTLPEANSRQERALKWAICAYALSLSAGGISAATRTVATEGAIKSFEAVNEIKIERAVLNSQQAATEARAAAQDWLSQAWSHLKAAGGRGWTPAVGASR